MNIWIFNHYAIGPNSSGITRHLDWAKYLVRKGCKVRIFASSFNYQTRKEEQLDESEKYKIVDYDGIEFVWIRTTPYEKNNVKRVLNMTSYFIRAKEISKVFKDQPDVIIGSLAHPLAAYLGYLVSRDKKALFYFEERDLWPQSLIDLGKFKKYNPIITVLYKLEKFLYRKADRIIVLFRNAKSYVTSKGINENKVLYLPNSIDPERIKNNSHELPHNLKQYFKENHNNKIVVYTGAHGLANNLDEVLDAAQLVDSNIKFLFVGDGPNKASLIRRVNDENISNVTFMNPIDKSYIPTLLKNCDIGLLPLKNSPVFKWGISPNKLFDYMSNKLPVILLCDIENSPVQEGEAGFVIKNNFIEQLSYLLNNISHYDLQKMGENGYDFVNEYHNWENNAGIFLSYLKEDLKRKK